MGVGHSAPIGPFSSINQCLLSGVAGQDHLVAFPSKPFFQWTDVRRGNLDIDVTPIAVTYPKKNSHVVSVIKCATEFDLKVQARSGGHSYGNYGVGGQDGTIVVDLEYFQQFSMDSSTWMATIGAGTRLANLDKKLHYAGGRAVAHGTCPTVGIGGHATVGGIGPPSRQWGLALDHVEELTVVLANSTITTASAHYHPDLFFALRGAAASFGVITEFKVHTQVQLKPPIKFSYSFSTGTYASMAEVLKTWQALVSDPGLPRKLYCEVVVSGLGVTVKGKFFGTQKEYENLKVTKHFLQMQSMQQNSERQHLSSFTQRIFGSESFVYSYRYMLSHWAMDTAEYMMSKAASPFFHKSLSFTNTTLMSNSTIDELFTYFDTAKKGTPAWFVIFDLAGGAINDVPIEATAYAHRNTLFFLQSYGISLRRRVSAETKDFLRGINDIITTKMPELKGTGVYPGYVDPEMRDGQRRYWGVNLEKLEKLKLEFDPDDVFSNPQSVRPAISMYK